MSLTVTEASTLRANAKRHWMRKNPDVIWRRGRTAQVRHIPKRSRSANWAIMKFEMRSEAGANRSRQRLQA
jgi:hypothetical protein